jgi:2,3-dihydroxybenzoate-AMP ligase
MFARTARRSPDKIALVQGEQRLTYGELLARSRDHAARLAGLGLRSGDLVLMQLPNTIEFVVSYLAVNLIGVIPVMALRAHRQAEVRHFLRASGATAYLIPDVVGGFDFRVMAREMQAEFPGLKHVFVAGEPAPGQLALASLPDAPAPVNGPRPADVSTMLLSGGTTSLSKLIPRTHDDYVLNARLCGAAGGFTDRTVFMAILPLGHNYNLASPGMLGAFYYGGTVVIAPAQASTKSSRWCSGAGHGDRRGRAANHDVAELRSVISIRSVMLAVVQNGGARLAPGCGAPPQKLSCTPQEIYGTAEVSST